MDTDEFDRLMGSRLRRRRRDLGLTQTQVGEAVGVTFQQIQKYERGAGVMAARLWLIAQAVNVRVAYFFDGIDAPRFTKDADRPPSGQAIQNEVTPP
jgi:transcriptional regulator with XRE-family HTH domain